MNAARWWGTAYSLAAAGPMLVLIGLYFGLPKPRLLPADEGRSYIGVFQQMALADSLRSLLGWVSLAAVVMAWRHRSAGRPVQAALFGLLFMPTLLSLVWSG
jgi:hypothetical protein